MINSVVNSVINSAEISLGNFENCWNLLTFRKAFRRTFFSGERQPRYRSGSYKVDLRLMILCRRAPDWRTVIAARSCGLLIDWRWIQAMDSGGGFRRWMQAIQTIDATARCVISTWEHDRISSRSDSHTASKWVTVCRLSIAFNFSSFSNASQRFQMPLNLFRVSRCLKGALGPPWWLMRKTHTFERADSKSLLGKLSNLLLSWKVALSGSN